MKNLLVYTSPLKKFDDEHITLVKIQIDNSFELGWKKEDILLVTNFDYEYNGIKSLVIGDNIWVSWNKASNKIPIVTHMLNQEMIDKKQLYWCHDFDAYQDSIIEEKKLGLDNFDLGLTTYCYKSEWNCGVFFFRYSARDIFNLLNDKIFYSRQRPRVDEKILKKLTDNNEINKKRYKVMNPTYNFQQRDVYFSYMKSEKPIKVLHFHPDADKKDPLLPDTLLNTFMYGKNRLGIPLMSDRLIKIFKKYGIS